MEWPLAAPLQMLDETTTHEPVDLPVNTRRISKREVVRPAFQVPIQVVCHLRDLLETLMTVRHLVQLVPFALDSLL
jgi:hypothetical protein